MQPAKSMVQTPPLLFGSSPSFCISCGDFMGQLSTTISVINQVWICHGRKGACDSSQNEFLLPDKYWSNTHVSAQLPYPYWSWIQPSLLLCFYVLGFNNTYAISSLVTSAPLGWPCISIFWWSSPSMISRYQPIPTLHSWVLFQWSITMEFMRQNHVIDTRPQKIVGEEIFCLKFPTAMLSWSDFAASETWKAALLGFIV